MPKQPPCLKFWNRTQPIRNDTAKLSYCLKDTNLWLFPNDLSLDNIMLSAANLFYTQDHWAQNRLNSQGHSRITEDAHSEREHFHCTLCAKGIITRTSVWKPCLKLGPNSHLCSALRNYLFTSHTRRSLSKIFDSWAAHPPHPPRPPPPQKKKAFKFSKSYGSWSGPSPSSVNMFSSLRAQEDLWF